MLRLYDKDQSLAKQISASVEIGTDSLSLGGRSFPFQVRRDSRARRMLLCVMPRDGAVVLVLPVRASLRSGQRFVVEQADWILARQDERPAVQVWRSEEHTSELQSLM